MIAPGAQHQCVDIRSKSVVRQAFCLTLKSRRQLCGRSARRRSGIEVVREAHELEVPLGLLLPHDFILDFNVSFKPERSRRRAARSTIFGPRQIGQANLQDLSGRSVFYRTKPARSSTPTRRTGRSGEEAPSKSSASSTQRRKVATRRVPLVSLGDSARPRDVYGTARSADANGRLPRHRATAHAQLMPDGAGDGDDAPTARS